MKKCRGSLLAWGLVVGLAGRGGAALSEVAFTFSTDQQAGFVSSIMDTTNGYAYFGSTAAVPGTTAVVRVDLSNFTIAPWAVGVSTVASVILHDSTRGYGYFVSSGTPTLLLKVRLSDAVVLSTLTFSGIEGINTGVIDMENQFALFGTKTNPPGIVRVDLTNNMTQGSSTTLPSLARFFTTAVYDERNQFAYFGSSTTIGLVTRIQATTLAATPLVFQAGEGGIGSSAIDVDRGVAYFGTYNSPGVIVSVRLSDFTRLGSLTLSPGEDRLTSVVIDTGRNMAFWGTYHSTSAVVQVQLGTTMTRVGALYTLMPYFRTALMDNDHYAYFGTESNAGLIYKVDTIAGIPEITQQPQNQTTTAGTSASFSVATLGRSIAYQWLYNGMPISGATAATYTRSPTTLDDNNARIACVVSNSTGSVTSNEVRLIVNPDVHVFPNPWRVDRHGGSGITFSGVRPGWTIKLFTLVPQWIRTLQVSGTSVDWDLKNDHGENVASGYYFFVIDTGDSEQRTTGKLAVIR